MYSAEVRKIMKRGKIKEGDRILVKKNKKEYEGLLMPKIEIGNPNSLVIKIDSGYNVGIKYDKNTKIERSRSHEPRRILKEEKFELGKMHPNLKKKLKKNSRKKTISILHTGGTVASRVSYKTGGVVSSFTPEDLVAMFPELFGIANIKTRLIRNMFSEDINIDHYRIMAREVDKEIKKGVDGIIITHGTDTMHYTAAALSFILQDLPIPVILVGAQRSSDRGSSDAALNIISAAYFIINSDFAEVAICMHGTPNDSSCLILNGCKSRKMHTSRRDTFRPINTLPWAIVDYKKRKIKFLRNNYKKKDKKRKLKIKDKFEKKVALVKIYPGISSEQIEFFSKNNYKGLVLEGTGLGHAPINKIDEFTKRNEEVFNALKKFAKKGIVVMNSQANYGRVNMNIYETGHKLQQIGVIPGEDMLSETAYLKLSWLLANYPKEKARELIRKNLVGEISSRTLLEEFLY
jgi:glutamyl-tRNA(Gln) amidotransferase subunit D